MAKLLEADFPGRDELRAQLAQAAVRTIVSQGAPAYLFSVGSGAPRAAVKQRIPVEAQAPDQDGVQIHFLVHVLEGVLSELELHREDGEPILSIPEPETLRVTVIG
jgi:hypothetical protein